MIYLKVSKGWLTDEQLLGLLAELDASGVDYKLLYTKSNAMQTYALVFRVGKVYSEIFKNIVRKHLKTKDKDIEQIR